MPAPQKNVAFTFDIALVDSANQPSFKANPTLATGDFKVSIDNGSLSNLNALPTVAPSSQRIVKVALTSSEMNGDRVTVICVDAAGSEWDDVIATINTTTATIDTVKTETASILADTNELQGDDVPGLISTLDAVVDTVKVDTAAILVDTNELQSDDVPGLISTLDAVVDTVKVDTAATLTDTNELQGDWTNGGRLDLIIDAILVDTGTTLQAELDGIQADTEDLQTQIGSAGAGLTGLGGMSSTMKAQINTEVDGSMVTYGLDHLLAASVAGSDVTDNSIIAKLVDDASTADWDNYDPTTASLEALNVDTDAIKAETALIVADTNELQGDDVPGLISTLDAVVDTVKVDTAATLVDTNELQGDWTNSGRLDTILDSILTDTGTTLQAELDGIQADTEDIQTQIGTAGVGLTNLGGMSTSMKAEVEAEVLDGFKAAGTLLHRATIATVTSQTALVIPASDDAPDDDAYNGAIAVIIDASDPNQVSLRTVDDYVASSRTVTLSSAPDFTVTNSDTLCLLATAHISGSPTAAAVADAVWDEAQSGHTTTGTFGDALTPSGVSRKL